MKNITRVLKLTLLLCLSVGFLHGQNTKLAQTGMKFLSVNLDARASALSGAVTGLENGVNSMFTNPAGMAVVQGLTHIAVGNVAWIAGINYLYGAVAINVSEGRYGVFGISFVTTDYGHFKGTMRADNEQGFIDTGEFSPSAFALGLGYAKSLSEKFSVGGHVRYAYQNLTGGVVNFSSSQEMVTQNFNVNVMAFDFGILYKTGYKSLNFGMSVRNFSSEIKYIRDQFQLPLTFEIGASFNMIDLLTINQDQHSLFLSVDAVHPRDYSEQLDIGVEYIFLKSYCIRFGFTSPTDEQQASFGAGVMQELGNFALNLDYAYTPFGVFDDVHRFTFKFIF